MVNRTFVMAAAMVCGSCATGEELDFSLTHPTAGSTGQSTATGSGNSTASTGGNGGGIGGSNGQSGSSATSSTTSGSGQSGSAGQAGGGGSGGAPQTDASPAGTGGVGGGASGAGGTSGSGGSIVMSDAGFVAGMQVLYGAQTTTAMSSYIGCELHAKNGGTSMVAVSELKLRYYYTNEAIGKVPTLTLFWSHITTGGAQPALTVTWMVNTLTPAKNNADTYIEFSLSSGQTNLAPNQSADFSWQLQGPNPSTDVYTQTNDYSFDATKTTPQLWDHVVLLRNGTVVWGTPPP
jgi:endoglucanase